MTKLIIDTTCDINSSITDNYDLEIIPLNITIDGKSYLDGVEIDSDAVYDKMREGKVPKTSQVSYESVTKAFDNCVLNGHDFIYLAFSDKMSGTYGFAKNILDQYKEKYPERRMEIIDSKGGAGAGGIIALQALKMIENNLPYETVIKQIEFMIDHMVYRFTIPDLEWLVKGGRVSKPLGYVGNILNLKPYLTVENGKIIFSKVVRGSKKVLKTLIKDVQAGTVNFKNQIIAISHSDDIETALLVEKLIKEKVEGCKTTIFQIGAVLGSHMGIGGVGVFFLTEKPQHYVFD